MANTSHGRFPRETLMTDGYLTTAPILLVTYSPFLLQLAAYRSCRNRRGVAA